MLPLLRMLAFIPMVLGLRLRRIERRTMERLQAAGATTGERAILLENGGAASGFVYRRLANAHAIVPVGNDRYYLDERGYRAFRGRRRRRAIIVVALLLIIIAVLYLRGDLS
jgi:hypothetical protein